MNIAHSSNYKAKLIGYVMWNFNHLTTLKKNELKTLEIDILNHYRLI